MLIYHGKVSEANAEGIESLTAILPVRVETGAPCVVLWHCGAQNSDILASSVKRASFGSFDTVLEKDITGHDGQSTIFRSDSHCLELNFIGDQNNVCLSFEPSGAGSTLSLSMNLIVGDPCISISSQYETAIFSGPVMIENKLQGDLVAVVLRQKIENGIQRPVSAFVAWASEAAAIEIYSGIEPYCTKDAELIPEHNEESCFALSSPTHQFHGVIKENQYSSPELQLCIRSWKQVAWQTVQNFPVHNKHNDAMGAMVSQFSQSYTTKVWNDTADPRHNTDPAIIICTIQQSGALAENYNKGMAAGGLFVALLGVAACAGPPAAGMVVGIGGLILAGQSVYDNFYEDPNKSRTRVLYLGDAVTRSANDRDDNEIILLRAYMTEGVDTTGAKRPMIKVTRYFLPKATAGQYSVTDILNNKNTVVEDQFGFYFREPHLILPRRYISIRGMRPTGTAKGSEDPPEELPKPSSGLWYDPMGKFKKFYARKERDKTTGRWGDVFDGFEYSKDVRDIVTLVEGIPTWLSSSIRITNLPDDRKTPVLVMEGWTASTVKDKIGHFQNETEVLKLIRNQRGSPFGFRWDITNPIKDSGDVYPIDWYNKGSVTKSVGSYLFFPIKDTDWTYTTTIVKKKTT